MPRVEELELEPRNVPQRTLKREVKREGLLQKRRARASHVSCAAQRSCMFAGGGEGTLLHPRHSYLPCQSTLCHLHRAHSSTGTLAVISLRFLSTALAFRCHILCLVKAVIYGQTGSCVCMELYGYTQDRGKRHPSHVQKRPLKILIHFCLS